jgi:hypothetical protein
MVEAQARIKELEKEVEEWRELQKRKSSASGAQENPSGRRRWWLMGLA